jgi:hypothetical protein
MSDTVSVSLGSISLSSDQAALLQAAADMRGKTLGELLSEGNSVLGLINDQVIQASARLLAVGTIPAEIVAEAQSFAAKQLATRASA